MLVGSEGCLADWCMSILWFQHSIGSARQPAMLGGSPQLCCPGCAAGLQRSNMSMADMTDGFVKNTESTFGKPNPSRDTVRAARRVVVKVQVHAVIMVLRR
jgi:hypothetical protein